MLQKPDAMIFDMDGTLFQTETLLLPAYHATFDQLRQEGIYQGDTPPDELMLGCLGMLLEQIWETVLPDASPELRKRADELFIHYEVEYLNKGFGQLYPGVEKTLKQLKEEGIRLFVASNGLEDYVRGVAKIKGIAPLFEELYSAGEHRTRTKVDLVAILLKRHNVHSAWMVGDRSSDVEAGLSNGLTVVGCEYAGFGGSSELDGATVRIGAFAELLQLYPHS